MKKISETLAKILTAVAVIPVISLSVIACTKKNPNEENLNLNVQQSSQTDVFETNTSNVSDAEEKNQLNGIYAFEHDINAYKDIYYTNDFEIQLYKEFGTNDINGVVENAKDKGLIEFLASITKNNEKEVSISFTTDENGNLILNYVYQNEDLSYSNSGKSFTYIKTEEGFVTNTNEAPAIYFDSENNKVTLLYQFFYLENGRKVFTRLYYSATLSLVPQVEAM